MGGPIELTGPDLERGAPLSSLEPTGKLLGHAAGEPVLVVRRGEELYAIGAVCTHYSGPLAEGLVVGDQVICPWHHACFDLRSGAASAPAFKPVPCYAVERRADTLVVTGRLGITKPPPNLPRAPKNVMIVGGGAAGHAALETLRNEGFDGPIVLVSADTSAPYDRTNVSKDYLAGTAPEEWMPMRPPEFYRSRDIELRLATRATGIDLGARRVLFANDEALPFEVLLLATGASPIELSIPGHDLPHVHYVRTLADSRAIMARLGEVRRAVVLGASFIGLEVAASLRARGVDVSVAAPAPPLERVLGPELSTFVRGLHEEHGVRFHIGSTASRITERAVDLRDGTSFEADLVVAGIGVRPALELAEQAGLRTDRGVVVDQYLETSASGVYAAGDIARFFDTRTGQATRIEHWVVAQRQGQTAAKNMLGRREPFSDVPFFWSQHYDVAINYVGHAERWDRIEVRGSLKDKDCLLAYRDGPRIAAIVTIGRDLANLKAEAALRRGDDAGLEAVVSEN